MTPSLPVDRRPRDPVSASPPESRLQSQVPEANPGENYVGAGSQPAALIVWRRNHLSILSSPHRNTQLQTVRCLAFSLIAAGGELWFLNFDIDIRMALAADVWYNMSRCRGRIL